MWNMKCFVILVIIGAAGTVTKGLKNLETIPRKHSVVCLQKVAALGTPHIIRKVLQAEAWWGAPLVLEEKYQGKGNLS
jgi:glutamate 5-kinase